MNAPESPLRPLPADRRSCAVLVIGAGIVGVTIAVRLQREGRDPAQLTRNTVPCVATIYAEDMFVPRALSERTAASIAGTKVWLTNEYEHFGLRKSSKVFERMLALRRELV